MTNIDLLFYSNIINIAESGERWALPDLEQILLHHDKILENNSKKIIFIDNSLFLPFFITQKNKNFGIEIFAKLFENVQISDANKIKDYYSSQMEAIEKRVQKYKICITKEAYKEIDERLIQTSIKMRDHYHEKILTFRRNLRYKKGRYANKKKIALRFRELFDDSIKKLKEIKEIQKENSINLSILNLDEHGNLLNLLGEDKFYIHLSNYYGKCKEWIKQKGFKDLSEADFELVIYPLYISAVKNKPTLVMTRDVHLGLCLGYLARKMSKMPSFGKADIKIYREIFKKLNNEKAMRISQSYTLRSIK